MSAVGGGDTCSDHILSTNVAGKSRQQVEAESRHHPMAHLRAGSDRLTEPGSSYLADQRVRVDVCSLATHARMPRKVAVIVEVADAAPRLANLRVGVPAFLADMIYTILIHGVCVARIRGHGWRSVETGRFELLVTCGNAFHRGRSRHGEVEKHEECRPAVGGGGACLDRD